MAGVRIVRINYKSVGAGVNGVLGGEVHLMFVNLASVSAYLDTGRLRPLAITSAEPSPLRPGLPTVAASALPGFVSFLLTGVFAPAGTPAAIVSRLNQEIVRAINVPDVREKFANIGIESVGSSPQELTAAMKSEIARMTKVIKEAGIRAD
jgi:tripartite-type tricarboxylate transporter receptor subunit TctC